MLPYIIIIISRAVRKISYFSSALSRLTSRSFLKSCNALREKNDNKNYVKIPFSKFLTVFNWNESEKERPWQYLRWKSALPWTETFWLQWINKSKYQVTLLIFIDRECIDIPSIFNFRFLCMHLEPFLVKAFYLIRYFICLINPSKQKHYFI